MQKRAPEGIGNPKDAPCTSHPVGGSPDLQPSNYVMPFTVQVGPRQLSIHDGSVALVSGINGQINSLSKPVFISFNTRIIGCSSSYANSEPSVS
jgi:hypothetical protein